MRKGGNGGAPGGNGGPPGGTGNILTIDVEEYFQVSALACVVRRQDWERYESRLEGSTRRILEILDSPPAGEIPSPRATFFVLAWNAERHPELIREIHDRGHEIACHGYDHRLIYEMTPEEFRRDVRRSKRILEDLIGEQVLGYRAPSYSITKKSLWALNILAEEGYHYDSSIFPVHHDVYGIPGARRFPFRCSWREGRVSFHPLILQARSAQTEPEGAAGTIPPFPRPSFFPGSQELLEFPVSTFRLFGQNFPVAGGGYFRFFPPALVRWALEQINLKGFPFIFYIHPWEIDPGQPRIPRLPWRSRVRHYLNLRKTERRFSLLLREIPFAPFRDFLRRWGEL